jgi:hypothetical protein
VTVPATLPDEVSSYHTVWVTPPRAAPVAVRYATSGGKLYCFGDDELREVADGTRVQAALHRIASGPPVVTFGATVRTVAPDDVEREVLLELLEHVPLGRSLDEVDESVARHRERRVVMLVA